MGVAGLVLADSPEAWGFTGSVKLTTPVKPILVTETTVDDGEGPATKAGIVLVEIEMSQTLMVTLAECTSVPLVPVTVTR